MSNQAGKGPEPRPVKLSKYGKSKLWDKRRSERLKPGARFTKVYSTK